MKHSKHTFQILSTQHNDIMTSSLHTHHNLTAMIHPVHMSKWSWAIHWSPDLLIVRPSPCVITSGQWCVSVCVNGWIKGNYTVLFTIWHILIIMVKCHQITHVSHLKHILQHMLWTHHWTISNTSVKICMWEHLGHIH